MAQISILGAGGWGLALATMLQKYGHSVKVWSAFEEELALIREKGENSRLLPGVRIPCEIALTGELACAAQSEILVLAVPSVAIRQVAAQLSPLLRPGTYVVNVSKGFEPQSGRFLSQVLAEALPQARVVCLSGPSHAEEVGKGIPTSVVCAARQIEDAQVIQDQFTNPCFRIYTNPDLIGVEIGGAVKNVIALAAGVCDGMGLGDNTKAALMTRGLVEIARLGVAMGAQRQTFSGLSGIGDLIVTCTSMHSRNRRAGILVGQGVPPAKALEQVGTVEGYYAAETVYALSQKWKVEMPITEQCYHVLYEGAPPADAIAALMQRPQKHENETLLPSLL